MYCQSFVHHTAEDCQRCVWNGELRCVVTHNPVLQGNLAPFDDEVGFSFRGPLNIENIAIYQPPNDTAATWKLTSSWATGQDPLNMVFMSNMGGSVSGNWSSM